MTAKLDLILHIFEKFGAPAFAAAVAAAKGDAAAPDAKEVASRAAALLTQAGQAGAELAKLAGFDSPDGQGDSARLALGGVCAKLLSALYRESGRLPGAAESERLQAVFSAIMPFAESFSSFAGTKDQALPSGDGVGATSPAEALVVQALAPVVGAIGAFSFGRPEKKLAQEIAARLVGQAREVVSRLPAVDMAADRRALAELSILRALAKLFSACYQAETDRLLALDEAARGQLAATADGALAMEPVWEAYNLRLGMMEAVAEGLFSSAGAEGAGAPLSQIPEKELQTSQGYDKPQAASEPAGAGKPSSPMGFFKKKKEEGA